MSAPRAQTVEFGLQNVTKQQIGRKAGNEKLRLGEPRVNDSQHIAEIGIGAVHVRRGRPAFIAVPECAPRTRCRLSGDIHGAARKHTGGGCQPCEFER